MFRALLCPSSGACDYAVEIITLVVSFCKDGGVNSNVVISIVLSQAPDDGHSNARNMLSL